jgi:CHAT domain-containing protein
MFFFAQRNQQHVVELADQAVRQSAEGRFDEAYATLQKVIILLDKLDPFDPNRVVLMNNTVNVLAQLGRFKEAEQLGRRALVAYGELMSQIRMGRDGFYELGFRMKLPHELYTRLKGTEGTIYLNLGNVLQQQGDLRAAYDALTRAIAIIRATVGQDQASYGNALGVLGSLEFIEKHDPIAAEPLLRESLEVLTRIQGKEHSDTINIQRTLSDVMRVLGRHQQADELRSSIPEARSPNEAAINRYIEALNAYSQRQFDKASELASAALSLFRDIYGENNPFVARCFMVLGHVMHGKGELITAERHYRQALAIQETIFGIDHPESMHILNGLLNVLADQGRWREALELTQRAANSDERAIYQVFSVANDRQRLQLLSVLQQTVENTLRMIINSYNLAPEAHALAMDLILRRKGLATEVTAAQHGNLLAQRYPQLAPQIAELNTLRHQITNLSLASTQPTAALERRREQLEIELARSIPQNDLYHQLYQVSRAAISSALPPGTALIELVRLTTGDTIGRYIAFVLCAGHPDDVRMIDLGPANEIDSLTNEFRNLISEQCPLSALDALGMALRQRVFEPLLPALRGRRRLRIAPDGSLNLLPFEVLPDGSGRIIDHYEISYLGVGRDILRSKEAFVSPAPPLILAAPDFDGATQTSATQPGPHTRSTLNDLQQRGARFAPLQGTETEGKRIASMLAVEPLLGPQATAEAMRTAQAPGIVHIATHGFFLDGDEGWSGQFAAMAELANPLLRSGLALAGANHWLSEANAADAAPAGILTAEEVTALHLYGTALIVLSACVTGVGEIRAGEGVFGLRRAFIVAGAQTLIVSLWKVPDAETCSLMELLYKQLLAGQGRAEALRQAQLAIKRHKPHPYYWGAFICQGDPHPLPWQQMYRNR